MNSFFSKTPTPGLTYFDSTSKDGYLVARNYIVIELVRDSYILDFYVVPSKDRTCIVLCHLPELAIIDSIRNDKVMLLRTMGYSKLFARILRNSLKASLDNDFTFVKMRDFVNPDTAEMKWCLSFNTPVPYNKVIFEESTDAGKFIGQILSDCCYAADDFYGVYNKLILDPRNKPWIANSRARKISSLACQLIDNDWGSFGCSLGDNTLNDKVKDLLAKEGYILLTDSGTGYPFDVPVPDSDVNESLLLVRSDLFFPGLKKKDYIFFIHLKPKGMNLWEAYVNIDKNVIAAADNMLNSVDTRKKRISPFSYRYLPYSAHIWFNSNPQLRGSRFEDNIECYLESDKKLAKQPFNDDKYRQIVKSGSSLRLKEPVAVSFSGRPWENLEPLAELIYYGLIVTGEIYNIVENSDAVMAELKKRNKERWSQLFMDTVKIYARINRII